MQLNMEIVNWKEGNNVDFNLHTKKYCFSTLVAKIIVEIITFMTLTTSSVIRIMCNI